MNAQKSDNCFSVDLSPYIVYTPGKTPRPAIRRDNPQRGGADNHEFKIGNHATFVAACRYVSATRDEIKSLRAVAVSLGLLPP